LRLRSRSAAFYTTQKDQVLALLHLHIRVDVDVAAPVLYIVLRRK